jgi:hypothetical protein
LFSESGYASTSLQTRLKSKQFEQEVIIAHSLQYAFLNLERAGDIFMEREKKKDWDDDEHKDDLWYIEQEPELFQTRGGNCDVADDNNEMNDGMGNRNVTELVKIDEE